MLGYNGAGKSTLLRRITGEELPDAGAITLDETIQVACVDQSREPLDGSKTVWKEIAGGREYYGQAVAFMNESSSQFFSFRLLAICPDSGIG